MKSDRDGLPVKLMRAGGTKPLAAIVGAAAVLLAILAGIHEVRRAYWDARVRELCEQRGGIRIFQKVELPEDQYRKLLNGENRIDLPEIGSAGVDQIYAYSTQTENIVRDALEVRKYVTRVLRTLDGAVLSEQVGYSRGAGRLPTLTGRAGNFSCHREIDELFAKTFIMVH